MNFVNSVKIELKKRSPEELTEKIIELVNDNFIKDKEIQRLKQEKKSLMNSHYGLKVDDELSRQKINLIKEICKNSINSINEKLKTNHEPFEVIDGKIQCLNDYQICRLKAIRMKCKEILKIIEGDK